MSSVSQINSQDFNQEVIEQQGLVLVDFYAQWCGPCKMVAPILETLSTEREDIKIVKVDADEAGELMAEHGIRGIPTLLLFNNGNKIGTKVGALSLGQLKEFIDQA
ncbi:thioredoxin [Algibacillus agarilyticus]|uniref:thioredoxin n=1 Tax=Algibacillus agarilyticus TaxID=2234133 RepID=UPI000DCF7867|nr:thioredoxin [Algibacillus agarilyticus]